jgi:Family of unknown function (DUF6519)
MGADRARISYDPSRQWRGVVNQQGRVTLEADWNEAAAIAAEEDRAQLLDVVGVSGTPDDGYAVSAGSNGDLTIGHGTLYVGGERMTLDTDLDYASQPDWVDTADDPLWVAPAVPQTPDESVYLLLREQEVGAVEDPALLDVALGGPDTSERLRILQRVVRQSTSQTSCSGALGDLEDTWAGLGLTFDPTTCRLDSAATLQVSFQTNVTGPKPCDPVAQGGYLGAENQLIRVQIANAGGGDVAPSIVWGFDNAYFLYRVEVASVDTTGDTTTLTLASAPVDSFHQPAKNQAVEVLRAAAQLTADDYIAAESGLVTTVETAYDADTGQVVIATALDATTQASPQLYLRVWQDTIPLTGGGPLALGDTGLQVSLSTSSGTYHVGDYWSFAVRPATPTTVSPVYPQRILDAPQPPDGPRLWACPLAVVAWSDGSAKITDCRNHFKPLIDQDDGNGCCTVEVTVDLADGGAGLQQIVDRYASQGPATICLQPGTYTLPRPLVISGDYEGLTIQACEPGVVLTTAPTAPRSFLLGMILLDDPTRFALRNVELDIPLVQYAFNAEAVAGIPQERLALLESYGRQLATSFGLYLRGGSEISIEGCTFTFGTNTNENVFGAAIFGTQDLAGLELVDCTFSAAEVEVSPFSGLALGQDAAPPYQVRFGYLSVATRSQAVTFRPTDVRAEIALAAPGAAASTIALPSLTDAIIERNVFDGLTVPVLVAGQLGTIQIEDNTVRSCYGGFWLISAGTTTAVSMFDRLTAGGSDFAAYFASNGLTALGDPVLLFAGVLGRVLPTTTTTSDQTGKTGIIMLPSDALLAAEKDLFTQLYSFTLQPSAQAEEPQATPEAEPPKRRSRAAKAPSAALDIELPAQFSDVFSAKNYLNLSDLIPDADPGTGLIPRLDVSSNQVDAVIEEADTGAGLLVVALDSTNASSLVCAGNRVRSRVVSGATATLLGLVTCSVTGNIVSNEIVPGPPVLTHFEPNNNRSLVLTPRTMGKLHATAVTGNVLVGPAVLPSRDPNIPAPVNVWDVFNEILPYSPTP